MAGVAGSLACLPPCSCGLGGRFPLTRQHAVQMTRSTTVHLFNYTRTPWELANATCTSGTYVVEPPDLAQELPRHSWEPNASYTVTGDADHGPAGCDIEFMRHADVSADGGGPSRGSEQMSISRARPHSALMRRRECA